MFAIHIHTLSSLQVRDAPESVWSGRSRQGKPSWANLWMTLPPPDSFLLKLPGNAKPRPQWRFPTWFSRLWSSALWTGKMAHYETPPCSLSCRKLKGMLLSVWGSPLICEMLCALWKDQAHDLSQYVCWCFDACSCEFSVLSDMFRTEGSGDQPRWVPNGSL